MYVLQLNVNLCGNCVLSQHEHSQYTCVYIRYDWMMLVFNFRSIIFVFNEIFQDFDMMLFVECASYAQSGSSA